MTQKKLHNLYYITIHNGLSNCGTRTTTGTSTTAYWCGALTKIEIQKEFKKFKKYKPYIFANTQHCWKHYVPNIRYQPVVPISDSLFKYKKAVH
jgi:hypothetical protein